MKTAALMFLIAWTVATGSALKVVTTPCMTEDSTLCYWNADSRGNSQGQSFIAVTDTLSIRTK